MKINFETMMKVLLTAALFAAALFAGSLFTACGEKPADQATIQPIAVQVQEVAVAGITGSRSFAGTAEPLQKVQISTPLSGYIEAINYTEGQAVTAGATLLTLRNEGLRARLSQTEAAIAEAEAHLQTARVDLQRIEALFARQAATQKELDDMRAAFTAAQARRQAAGDARKEVQEQLSYTILKAPFAGVVTRKWLEVGDLAGPGQPLIEVENSRQMKILSKVPETEIAGLSSGMTVAVEASSGRSGQGQRYSGRISKIFPAADPVSRQFDLEVLLDNRSGEIRSGTFTRVILQQPGDATLQISRTALFRRGQLQGVYVIDDAQQARLRWVRTGSADGEVVEILSGLQAGDRVAVSSLEQLYDGAATEVQQ